MKNSDITVKCFVSQIFKSNCYVVYNNNKNAVIVDPGLYDISLLIEFVKENELNVHGVLLTHEHFDHIFSVKSVKDAFNCDCFSHTKCAQNVNEQDKNLSDKFSTFKPDFFKVEHTFNSNCDFLFKDLNVEAILTVGHTESSVTYRIGDNLFTGDALIPKYPTEIYYPGGNKKEIIQSLIRLRDMISKKNTYVCAGHGNTFDGQLINFDILSPE